MFILNAGEKGFNSRGQQISSFKKFKPKSVGHGLTMGTRSLKALPVYSSKWCIVLQTDSYNSLKTCLKIYYFPVIHSEKKTDILLLCSLEVKHVDNCLQRRVPTPYFNTTVSDLCHSLANRGVQNALPISKCISLILRKSNLFIMQRF